MALAFYPFTIMNSIQYLSAEKAVERIQSGNRVFLHGSAATPVHLIKALLERHRELQNVELVSITSLGDIDFDRPEFRNSFFFNSLFVSANTRSVVNSDHGDYVPVFLSQLELNCPHGDLRLPIFPAALALIGITEDFCSCSFSGRLSSNVIDNC